MAQLCNRHDIRKKETKLFVDVAELSVGTLMLPNKTKAFQLGAVFILNQALSKNVDKKLAKINSCAHKMVKPS